MGITRFLQYARLRDDVDDGADDEGGEAGGEGSRKSGGCDISCVRKKGLNLRGMCSEISCAIAAKAVVARSV